MNNDDHSLNYARFPRRMAALVYDTLITIALCLLVASIYVSILLYYFALPDVGTLAPIILQSTLFPLLIATIFFYYAWHWRHQGITLGMHAWHLQAVSIDGRPLSWPQCVLRFSLACLSITCLGLGYWWALWQRNHATWHDLGSNSYIIKRC